MTHIAKVVLAAAVIVTGCSEEEGTPIGPRGGIVSSDDGRFTLEIPAGALDQEIDITVDEVECEQPTALGPCYEVGPIGLPLNLPGHVTYELDLAPEEMEALGPDAVTVLTETEHDWRPLSDREVDMVDAIVCGSAVYLSSFAAVVTE